MIPNVPSTDSDQEWSWVLYIGMTLSTLPSDTYHDLNGPPRLATRRITETLEPCPTGVGGTLRSVFDIFHFILF